jgi:Protein of unknown function (DUF3147)
MEYVIRFLMGGLFVSALALLGDILRPKSFAGLFSAAPSVALASLSLALLKDGEDYVAIEARSMIIGSIALALFSVIVCQIVMRFRCSALSATSLALVIWAAVAFGTNYILFG